MERTVRDMAHQIAEIAWKIEPKEDGLRIVEMVRELLEMGASDIREIIHLQNKIKSIQEIIGGE